MFITQIIIANQYEYVLYDECQAVIYSCLMQPAVEDSVSAGGLRSSMASVTYCIYHVIYKRGSL